LPCSEGTLENQFEGCTIAKLKAEPQSDCDATGDAILNWSWYYKNKMPDHETDINKQKRSYFNFNKKMYDHS
jgi:hypothetical protein